MQNPIIQQVIETLRGANSVLITVKNSPSVDELTAAISLTLILNHMEKNATTVFSGKVPSTIEFLQPDMAIEQNTDSLRDFIIALDKAKADKLRYKVEDNVVRIFITPYKSSITEEDLEFSQGDLNVDVVVTLGVLSKDDFDEAIVSHGRILHDATVISMSSGTDEVNVGTINWQDSQASGVSEMVAGVSDLFGPDVIDNQVATSLLTGIVSETGRFKNEKTTPQVLAISSKLMAAGANQQLIAEKLDHTSADPSVSPLSEMVATGESVDLPQVEDETSEAINIDEDGNMLPMLDDSNDNPIAERLAPVTNDESSKVLPASKLENDDSSEADEKPIVGERVMLSSPSDQAVSSADVSKDKEPTGLFGSSLHNTDGNLAVKNSDESLSALEKKTLGKEKLLEPLHEGEEVGPKFILDPIPVQEKQQGVAPDGDQVVSTDTSEKTLRQLERAVGSSHLDSSTPDPASNIDEYMGSAIPPVDDTPLLPPVEKEELSVPVDSSVVGDLPLMPDASSGSPVQKYEASNHVSEPAADKVARTTDELVEENEGAAPEVPPPLMPAMPQVASKKQPMFFEADGSQSNPIAKS